MKSHTREVEVLLHLAENLDRELFFLTADKAILEGTFPHAEPERVRDSLHDVLKGLLEYLVIGFLYWKDGSGELSLLLGGPVSQDFLEQFALHIVNEAEKAFECRIRPEDVFSAIPLDLTHSIERSFQGSFCSVPVPLSDTGQVLVAVAHDKPAALPADSCEILRRAAPSIRMALANAELAQRIRTERENVRTLLQRVIETQEWEKKRIADQVHDGLVQPLIGILAGLRFILRDARKRIAQPAKLMGEAMEALGACVTQGRRMIFELHPPLLEQLGLVPLIREYVGHLSGEESFTPHLSVRGTIRRLSPIVEVTAFRILQEALRNASRHSGASEVWISLYFRMGVLLLGVRDNGCGFDRKRSGKRGSNQPGLGLIWMRERLRQLGGGLLIKGRPGRGTVLRVEIPFPDEQEG